MGLLGSLLKVAAPVAGFALGGPAGAAAGSAIGGAIAGSQDQAKAGKLTDQASALKMAEYNQLAPVRQKAIDLALAPNPQRLKLGAIFEDRGNPYNRAGNGISALWDQNKPAAAPAPPPDPTPPPMTGLRKFAGNSGIGRLFDRAEQNRNPGRGGNPFTGGLF